MVTKRDPAKKQATDELFQAAIDGDAFKLQAAIEAGAHISGVRNGMGIMFHATSAQCVEILANAGISAGGQIPGSRTTPLHLAAYTRNASVVNALIKHGADVNATEQWGNTPLHTAYTADCARLLLAARADPDARNSFGETPIYDPLARLRLKNTRGWRESKLKTVDFYETVLTAGANPSAYSKRSGSTPLHNIPYCRAPELIEVLVRFGANVDAMNENGETPLANAIRGFSHSSEPDLATVKALLAAKANPMAKSGNGKCAFEIAESLGRLGNDAIALFVTVDSKAIEDAMLHTSETKEPRKRRGP